MGRNKNSILPIEKEKVLVRVVGKMSKRDIQLFLEELGK